MKKTGVWMLVLIIMIFAGHYIFTTTHEITHSTICESFGGTVTNMTVGVWGGQSTCAIVPSVEYTMAQANVDAIGYQLLCFYDMLVLLLMFTGILWRWKRRD